MISLAVAELFGTMILVIFGLGSNAQSILAASSGTGGFVAIRLGWGVGLGIAILFTAGLSDAHLNPAITTALAIFGKLSWRLFPIYVLAQILGAFLGGIIVQANYYELTNTFEGGRGTRTFGGPASSFGVYVTTPTAWMSNTAAFFDEVLGTFLFTATAFQLRQSDRFIQRVEFKAFVLAAALIGVSSSVGVQTSFALNPARDLGPRMAASVFGYPNVIWSYRHGYWLWGPILGPLVGAVLGFLMVDIMTKLNTAGTRDARLLPQSMADI